MKDKQVMEELMHWFLNGETHCIYPENIPEHVDSKDSSEEVEVRYGKE